MAPLGEECVCWGYVCQRFLSKLSLSFPLFLEPQGKRRRVSFPQRHSLGLYIFRTPQGTPLWKHKAASCVPCGLVKAAPSICGYRPLNISVRSSSCCQHLHSTRVSLHAELCKFYEKVKNSQAQRKTPKFTFKSDRIKFFLKRILSKS